MLQESSPRHNPPPPLVGVRVVGAVRVNLAPLLAAFTFGGRVQVQEHRPQLESSQ